jgi:pimeloyl-ACP methyl ester carboxylesterase
MSGGQYISLGWFEHEDVGAAIEYLGNEFGIGKFALWGRSMGAATAFFAIRANALVCAAVVDSAFRSLPVLLKEILCGFPIPNFLNGTALWYLRKKIQQKAHFNVAQVVPEEVAVECRVPVFMIHADGDDLIDVEHSRVLVEKYGGNEKEIRIVSGNHDSRRPTRIVCEAVSFIGRAFGVSVGLHDARELMLTVAKRMRLFESRVRMVSIPDVID